ncbi:putative porin [Colwelliaceae bacterium 6471]
MKRFTLSSFTVLLLTSGYAVAEDYQSISNAQYMKTEADNVSIDTSMLNTTYYLSKKSTLGPLDQFDYINTTSNIFASYMHTSLDDDTYDASSDSLRIGGEYFLGKFLIGASYQNTDYDDGDSDATSLRLGYLFSKNFLVQAEVLDLDDGGTEYLFSAAYNHQINGSDYLGFTARSDNDFDYKSISAKYFMKLNQGQYFITELMYQDGKYDNYWGASASYYFDDNTSISADYDDNDNYRLGVKHFINKNIALSAGYGANTDESDYDVIDVGLTFQF